MSEAIDLFPIKILRDRYEHAADLKESLFSKLDTVFEETKINNNVFMKDGTLCSYYTGSDLHKKFPLETKQVVDFIESMARKYWQLSNYHEDLEPFVYQMWANRTPKGGWVQNHLHGNMPFTAVLYVDASLKQGNIVLENPLDTVLMTQPIGPKVGYPMEQEIEVNTGDVIMFPGFLKHSVRPNTTEEPRLALAFNIGCRGNYWSSNWVQNV